MSIRVITDAVQADVLVHASGANYTQVFTEIFEDCNRVTYMLIAHASCNVVLNATIASDSAGTGATDVLGTGLTCNDAGEVTFLNLSPNELDPVNNKTFVSAKVTFTAGTYTLIRLKYDLKTQPAEQGPTVEQVSTPYAS